MNKQIITTPNGERLVMLPEAEFEALLNAAEDAADIAAINRFEEMLASGEEELIPAEFVYRIADGENPIRVWREFRGMSATSLAEKAGISGAYLSEIETGKKSGSIAAMKKVAEVLRVNLDDIA